MSIKTFRDHVDRLFVKPDDTLGKILHASVGIAGEAGEILDAVKKAWIYQAELDNQNLLEEVGDSLFYLQALAIHCGFTLEDAMRANIEKLSKRYPQGYTDQAEGSCGQANRLWRHPDLRPRLRAGGE